MTNKLDQLEAFADGVLSRGDTAMIANPQTVKSLIALVRECKEALEKVMPLAVTQVIACHGMKCREPVCMSCNGEDDAEAAAKQACVDYDLANHALAAIESFERGEG